MFKRPALAWTWKYTLIGLLLGLIGVVIFWYGYSPRPQVKHTLAQLQLQDFAALDPAVQQVIRDSMIQSPQRTTPNWNGLGRQYLQKIWPTINSQVEPHTLFLLQINQYLADQSGVDQGYQPFPDHYQVSIGTPTIELTWRRQGLWTWQLQRICSDQPQPLVTLQTCSSASR
jgi:hypothetical protein